LNTRPQFSQRFGRSRGESMASPIARRAYP
jgi:hypothetical protein